MPDGGRVQFRRVIKDSVIGLRSAGRPFRSAAKRHRHGDAIARRDAIVWCHHVQKAYEDPALKKSPIQSEEGAEVKKWNIRFVQFASMLS
jgi:hypothetical protein